MAEEIISHEFRLKNTVITRINLVEKEFRLKNTNNTRTDLAEIYKQNELISRKYKKVWNILNYTDHSIILASTVTGCVSIFVFSPLVGTPVGAASSAVGIKIFPITRVTKTYKSIIEKKRNMIKQYY